MLEMFLSISEPKMESKSESRSSDTVKPDMPPPPSPASSTCSDHSGPGPLSECFPFVHLQINPGSVTFI